MSAKTYPNLDVYILVRKQYFEISFDFLEKKISIEVNVQHQRKIHII